MAPRARKGGAVPIAEVAAAVGCYLSALNPDRGELVSREEIAELLDVSQRTLQDLEARGFPVVHRGDRVGYRIAEAIVWKRAREYLRRRGGDARECDHLALAEAERIDARLNAADAPDLFVSVPIDLITALAGSRVELTPAGAALLEGLEES